MRWRHPSEIAFRVRQEARNLALLARPPQLPRDAAPRSPLPDPEPAIRTLRDTPARQALIAIADRLLVHRFPLLGLKIDTGPEIHWRRDYVNHKETPAQYFRGIPYLNASVVGDHKIIWELNRHQHLVLLAQAYRLTGAAAYLDEIARQLESWFAANPTNRGINWCSALEVAFRALSWIWVDHLAGEALTPAARRQLREGLYRHAFHLEANLSVYFSPNTHLLGEALALHALGVMFRGIGPAERWARLGDRIVGEEMQRQVHADGSHFEQSSYYHVYALDMFLFHALLSKPSEAYLRSLERMAIYLDAMMGTDRSLAFLGDDDGGRLFHPFGPRDRFGAATLAVCGCFLERPEWIRGAGDLNELAVWWLGERACAGAASPSPPRDHIVRFPDAGVLVMSSGSAHCIVDAGPFGPFRGGHSHADALSMVARSGGRELLIDPGTFSYAGDSPWRDRFRGTAAHNTVRIGGLDQADPAGPFGWRNQPQVEIREWRTADAADFLDAACRYRGFQHRRRVLFLKPDLLFILDDIEGEEIEAEQFWHPGGRVELCAPGCFRIEDAGLLLLPGDSAEVSEGGEFGWRSRAYGARETAPVIVSRSVGRGAVQFAAVLAFSARPNPGRLRVRNGGGNSTMILGDPWRLTVTIPSVGMPSYRSD